LTIRCFVCCACAAPQSISKAAAAIAALRIKTAPLTGAER